MVIALCIKSWLLKWLKVERKIKGMQEGNIFVLEEKGEDVHERDGERERESKRKA